MYATVSANQLIKETEKAAQYQIEVELWSGKIINWNIWLPKSVLAKCTTFVDVNGNDFIELSPFALKLLADKLPQNAKEIR